MKFLDTNVILRYLTRDDRKKAEACYEFFQRVKAGVEEVITLETNIAEVCYVLSSSRAPYGLEHHEISARLMPILTLRGIRLPHKGACIRALDLYGSSPFLDFEDALAVAHMERLGVIEIVSYDRDFDRLTGVRRAEPL